MELLHNARARARLDESPGRDPLAFHRKLPGYAPTPLLDVPELARALGVGAVLVKDESRRLGLPAFKIAGASWAAYVALEAHRGRAFAPWERLEALADQLAGTELVLVAATDGNHGRAVARMARLLGLGARIFVPDDMVPARRAAIAGEGAEVVVVAGTYDDAVRRSAQEADARHVVVSDTSWPGYEAIPRAVVDGYSTLLWEIDDALAERGEPGPDVVLVQVGVGAFAAAVTRHYRRPGQARAPRIVSVEPTGAACVLASMRAGAIVELAEPPSSIMSGLNCGTPSLVAWPVLRDGVDLFCAVQDEVAREGMRVLAEVGIEVGECSGGGVGAALRLLGPDADPALRERLGVTPDARVLLFFTEGVTDPDAYDAILAGTAA